MAERVHGGDSTWSPSHSGVCSVVASVVYTELGSPPVVLPLPLKTLLVCVTLLLHPVEEVLLIQQQ